MPDAAIKNWIPYKLVKAGEDWQCHWLNTFNEPFNEPFFSETILKCKGLAYSRHFPTSVSDLAMMKEWSAGLTCIEPSAFIFHISRCGSTLVAQLLASVKENIVLSEVPFFDDLLGLVYKTDVTKSDTSALFAAALKFYGQRRAGSEKLLFVKTDSWHIFYYEQLRRMYPSVPFIFIYRRPDEVFASLKKQPGMHSVPGLVAPVLLGFDPGQVAYEPPDSYIAHVLERYLQRYIEIAAIDKLCLFLNYAEGPMEMIKKIAVFTRTRLSGQDLFTMAERGRYHAKRPHEQFSEEQPAVAPSFMDKAIALHENLKAATANHPYTG